MGPGDNPELTPSDADVAAAEEQTRRLLAGYGEPALVEPPPGLASRVVAALPASRRPLRPLRLRVGVWAAAAAALVLAIGALGVLGAGAAPGVAGSPATLLGRLSLTIAQAARPLIGPLIGAGLIVILVALAGAGAIWLWRRGAHRRDGG